MELQFNKIPIRFLTTAARGVQNGELTQEVRLSDGMPDIGRVLTSWGQMILRSKEWRTGMVSVSGGVMVWILYVPEDGTEPRTMETWIPFTLKWDLPDTDREGPIRIAPLIRFVDSRGISARKIMVRVGIAAMGEALYLTEKDVYESGEVPEDVQILKRTYPVRLVREAGEKQFLLDEDLTLPDSAPGMEKLLSYSVNPDITEKKVLANKMVFRGSGNLHLVYRDAEGKIHTWDFELPFSQYAELEGEYGPDAGADVQTAVTNLELDMNEPGKLRIKCSLVCQYLIDDRQLLELTEDAYSPFREVTLNSEPLVLPVILDDRAETVTAEQTVPGQNGQAVDINFLPDFPRQRRSEDGIELELPAMFQTLYYGEDGSLQSANARWEGSMNLPADENSRVSVTVKPQGRGQAMPGMEGLGLTGTAQMQLTTTTEQAIPMVMGLELGELQEPNPARPSLVLCRPGSEELWNIAKRCGSTVEAIRNANGIEGEPRADQMLLIPVS